MAIRAVVFDVAGVLARTPSTTWQARWEKALCIESGAIDERLLDVYRAGTIGAITRVEAERQIAQRLALDEQQREALMADYWHEYLGAIDALLARWFGALRPRYRTGILSNSWVGAREKEEAHHAFSTLADTIVYSHEEGMTKPDPRIYRIVCDRLDVTPEETLFLDDLEANVAAARTLGMPAVLHRGNTPETIAELEALLVPTQGFEP